MNHSILQYHHEYVVHASCYVHWRMCVLASVCIYQVIKHANTTLHLQSSIFPMCLSSAPFPMMGNIPSTWQLFQFKLYTVSFYKKHCFIRSIITVLKQHMKLNSFFIFVKPLSSSRKNSIQNIFRLRFDTFDISFSRLGAYFDYGLLSG